MFLAANNLIRAENMLKNSFPTWDYIEEWYKEAGIGDIWDKREIIREYEKEKAIAIIIQRTLLSIAERV